MLDGVNTYKWKLFILSLCNSVYRHIQYNRTNGVVVSRIHCSYDWSLVLLYKTRETGVYCTEQLLNESVLFCCTKQKINMAVFILIL